MTPIVRNATRVLRGLFVFRLLIAIFAAILLSLHWKLAPPAENR